MIAFIKLFFSSFYNRPFPFLKNAQDGFSFHASSWPHSVPSSKYRSKVKLQNDDCMGQKSPRQVRFGRTFESANTYVCVKHVRMCQTRTSVSNMYVCVKMYVRMSKHVCICQRRTFENVRLNFVTFRLPYDRPISFPLACEYV